MVLLTVLAALIVLILAAAFFSFRFTFYNKNDRDVTRDPYKTAMADLIESALKFRYKEVYITSYDGLRLFGRLYYQKKGAPFHIQFNGYRGNGLRDFAGGLQLALSTGQNVLLVDQRSHGRSQGHVITFGIRERRDVLSWMDFVTREYGADTPIYLEGVSMGAATVLMASDFDFPANVRGIVADCPYSSPMAIIAEVSKKLFRIRYLTYPLIILSAFLFGHFNILGAAAEKSVKSTKTPVLLIHGTGDHFVPYEMSVKIQAANPEMVTLVTVEGAPHGLSYLKDYEKYKAAFYTFTEKTCPAGDTGK